MSHHFLSHFIRLPFFFRILFIAMFLVTSFGCIIYIIEPETFSSIFEGIWWAIITASTVGYGDLVPQTTLGKIMGILLILLGAGFLSSFFVTLATTTVKRENDYREGKMIFKGKNHIVVIGWNERSRAFIEKLLERKLENSIVLMDETLKTNPFSDYHVQFIQGKASLDDVLIKANIYDAKVVLITADQNKDELQADMNTILTLLAIKGLNPTSPCIVEILTPEQVANAKRAGADEVIQSNIISSSVMINCINSPKMVNSLMILLEQFNGSRFVFQSSNSFVGKDFIETNIELLKGGTLLFGIKRGTETIVNPPQPFVIKENDILLVITDS